MKKCLILLLSFPLLSHAETYIKVNSDIEVDLDSVKQDTLILKQTLPNENYAMIKMGINCKQKTLRTISTHFYNKKGINYKTQNNVKDLPKSIQSASIEEVLTDIACHKEIRNELKMIMKNKMMD